MYIVPKLFKGSPEKTPGPGPASQIPASSIPFAAALLLYPFAPILKYFPGYVIQHPGQRYTGKEYGNETIDFRSYKRV